MSARAFNAPSTRRMRRITRAIAAEQPTVEGVCVSTPQALLEAKRNSDRYRLCLICYGHHLLGTTCDTSSSESADSMYSDADIRDIKYWGR